MRINHNISALKTNNQLFRTGKALDRSLERLSSGYKINRASDDAAGMAISRKMKTQIEGLERASMNGSDGISVIQTTEGALEEVQSMLQRMRELSVQAANGVNTTEDRMSIQLEINQLRAEIQRISDDTEFNTKKVLNGGFDNNSYTDNEKIELIYISDDVPATEYNLTVEQDARQAIMDCGSFDFGSIDEDTAGTITINGYPVVLEDGDDDETVFKKIRDACDLMNIKAFISSGVDTDEGLPENGFYTEDEIGSGNLILKTEEYGSNQIIKISCNNEELASAMGLSTETVTAYGIDAMATLGEGFSPTATVEGKGDILIVRDSGDFEMRFRVEAGMSETVFNDAMADGTAESEAVGSSSVDTVVTLLNAGRLSLQLGANEGQNMLVRIPRVDPVTLGINTANVCTPEGANLAITIFDEACSEVSAIRAKLGAYQNRLEHATANLDTTSINMTEAMSRIEDVDMAEEMTNYTQQNVLDQAGISMLSHANERPQNIMALLQA